MRLFHLSASWKIRIGLLIALLAISGATHAQVWHSIASMNSPRTGFCAIAFPDGRVLAVGGSDGTQALSSCEIYNPKTDTWTLTGSMNEPRSTFPMITLSDGRIMVAGGLTDLGIATTDGVEIYDTQTGVWTQMAPMSSPRENFPMYLLPNGKVFICGGANANTDTYLNTAEVFDPSTNTYQEVSSFPTQVFAPNLFYDSGNNRMLLQGGSYGGINGIWPPILQVYDFTSNSWSYGPQTIIPHDASNVQMPDQSIVLMGGRTGPYTCTDTIERLLSPFNTSWQFIGRLTSKRWHGPSVVVGDDSILAIGGDNDPGINTNIFDSTNWFLVNEKQTLQGPIMLATRSSFVAILSKQPVSPCIDSDVIYAFGGASTTEVLSSCEALPLGVKYEPGYAPASLALPATTQSIAENSCGTVDTSVLLGVAGCGITSGTLDSVWLSGSSAFHISDTRSSPRTLATIDSIAISYLGTSSPDTTQLHVRFDLGSGARDTVVTLIGTLASPLLAEPEQIHREAASAYFGQIDTLALGVDISSQINLDSLWPSITEIQATYSWDSSVVSYAGYLQPSGWTATSTASHGNLVDIDIQNTGSTPSQPVNLGTALFRPRSTQLATTWVELPSFVIDVGTQAVSLCVTDNEDNHWAVKALGVQSGVAEVPVPNQDISIYPNPAGDELFVQNTNDLPVSITMFDAVGRIVSSASAASNSTASLDIESLPNGSYVLICHVGDQILTRRVNKLQ